MKRLALIGIVSLCLMGTAAISQAKDSLTPPQMNYVEAEYRINIDIYGIAELFTAGLVDINALAAGLDRPVNEIIHGFAEVRNSRTDRYDEVVESNFVFGVDYQFTPKFSAVLEVNRGIPFIGVSHNF